MATSENLQNAFAGESQANRKYLAFARQAVKEGFPQIAKLFRAAADAETVHALNHFRVMGWPKSTQENLQAASSGENYEFTQMYPQFIDQAKKEDNRRAAQTFDLANKVEQIHYAMYNKALETIKSGKDMPDTRVFVCSVCGNTIMGDAPDKCPICQSPKDKFMEVK